uniref:uncharacterized protein KIAA2026-like n=1 Tax=Styela clava TaxID=7725 RepID=UPI001939D814|nr:uncharacterized protein KIAA2026-like [Styela clava]
MSSVDHEIDKLSKETPQSSDKNDNNQNTPGTNKSSMQLAEDKTQELETSYRILTEIVKQNKSTCWPFMEKVDIKGLGLWDYEKKIKEPMWLNKIIEKFESKQYSGITEFARDFRTMVENCYRYNGTENAISKRAKRIEMIFEGKIALLKKELKDKASIFITSKGKFAIDMNDDNLAPVSRYGRIGNAREYAFGFNDTDVKLVYDFVKCEETVLGEDDKKSSYRERRQQELLYQRIAAAWINTIDGHEDAKLIRTSHLLPEIGFFLHFAESVLKFPELNMYLLERCIIIPENSLYLAKIMTSLLCTYQERSQLNQRPPMHFSTWNKRLNERLSKWFEIVQKTKSYLIASEKLGISIEFFESMEWKNQLHSLDKMITFTELKFAQKLQILKALCDSSSLLQSVQNALLAMDSPQLQCMQLGKDYLGNIYIYFPQFCGDDVRVYRHREFGEPVPKYGPDEIWVPERPVSSITDIVASSVPMENDTSEGSTIKHENSNEIDIEKENDNSELDELSKKIVSDSVPMINDTSGGNTFKNGKSSDEIPNEIDIENENVKSKLDELSEKIVSDSVPMINKTSEGDPVENEGSNIKNSNDIDIEKENENSELSKVMVSESMNNKTSEKDSVENKESNNGLQNEMDIEKESVNSELDELSQKNETMSEPITQESENCIKDEVPKLSPHEDITTSENCDTVPKKHKDDNLFEAMEVLNNDTSADLSLKIENNCDEIPVTKAPLPQSAPMLNGLDSITPSTEEHCKEFESNYLSENLLETQNDCQKEIGSVTDNVKEIVKVTESIVSDNLKSDTETENVLENTEVDDDIKVENFFEEKKTRLRKKNPKYSNPCPVLVERRSLRKRTSTVERLEITTTPVKRQKVAKGRTPKKTKQESQKKVQPEKYGNVDFEMLCDNVDAIQLLINDLEAQQTEEKLSVYGKTAFQIHKQLINKLRWLYEELEPWNIRLQKARLQAQVQMKREHDQIQNAANKIDHWSEELTNKNTYTFGDNVTISHMAVDSPMSSVASFDDGSGDEDYTHSYFTRRNNSPPPRIIDESLFENERQTLLTAALFELEEILKENLKELLKIADRTQLEENSSTNDRRQTRQKIKQQNKVLGKVLNFAEENIINRPSLLPILIPDGDVYDIVDMLLLKEETRLEELAKEQRRKRLERAMRRVHKPVPVVKEREVFVEKVKKAPVEIVMKERMPSLERIKTLKKPTIKIVTKPIIPAALPSNISIKMRNGNVYAATRLSDGRVVPIARGFDNPSAASTVDELVKKVSNTASKTVANYTVPHISLRGANSPNKVRLGSKSSPNKSNQSQTSQFQSPSKPTHLFSNYQMVNIPINQLSTSSPLLQNQPIVRIAKLTELQKSPQKGNGNSLIKIKQSPKKIVVTQPLRRPIINSVTQLQQTSVSYPLPMLMDHNQNNPIPTSQNNPVPTSQQDRSTHFDTTQENAVVPNQSEPVQTSMPQQDLVPVSQLVQTMQKPIILNGPRYNVVNTVMPLAMTQQPQIYNSADTQTVFLTQPLRFGQPILTPIQIITPNIKFQPPVGSMDIGDNQQNNMVFIPIQSTSTVPTQITASPAQVLNIVSSPQTQVERDPSQQF